MMIKLNQLMNFANIYPTIREMKLPIKTSFKLTKIAQLIESNTAFYSEHMNEIIAEYSLKDEEGNPKRIEDGNDYFIDPERINECNKKVEELYNLEIDVPYTFTLEEFDNIELNLAETSFLIPFITE